MLFSLKKDGDLGYVGFCKGNFIEIGNNSIKLVKDMKLDSRENWNDKGREYISHQKT